MNARNLILITSIGLLYLLIGSSLYLQYQLRSDLTAAPAQSNPVTVANVNQTVQDAISGLEQRVAAKTDLQNLQEQIRTNQRTIGDITIENLLENVVANQPAKEALTQIVRDVKSPPQMGWLIVSNREATEQRLYVNSILHRVPAGNHRLLVDVGTVIASVTDPAKHWTVDEPGDRAVLEFFNGDLHDFVKR